MAIFSFGVTYVFHKTFHVHMKGKARALVEDPEAMVNPFSPYPILA